VAAWVVDGTDFSLHIDLQADSASEYKDKTSLVPQSSTAIVYRNRLPQSQQLLVIIIYAPITQTG